jgi:hypothetical protein
MERALGADFGQVRIHTDDTADGLNRSLEAEAFNTGQDIYFSRGAYQPGSAAGRKLLAHELTHTIQQASTGSSARAGQAGSEPEGESEQEAETIARQVASGVDPPPGISRHLGAALARQAAGDPASTNLVERSDGAQAAPGQAAPGQAADTSGPPDQTAPGASLVNNPQFEKLVEAMEADGEDANTTWKSQVNDGVFGFLAPEIHAEYTADGTDCDKARGDFNLEWNKIVAGKGDPKQLLAAYDIFSLQIGALQQANARVAALIAIDFATKIAPFLAFVMKLKKFDLAQQFKKRLEKLLADLDKAETAVTKAEVKTALNIAVSVITTIVAPEATLAKVLLAGGGMAAHIVIDRSLGEGTVTGTAVFVAGDSGEFIELSKDGKEAIEKLRGGSKTIGVAAAVVTAALDVNDVFEGKEVVEKIKVEIEETRKGFDDLMAGVLPLIPDFIMLDKLIQALPDVVNKALTASNDAAKNYDAIKQEIQKVIQEGD